MHRFRTGAGNGSAPHCRDTGFVSPGISPRPGFCSSLQLIFFSFLFLLFSFLHWWEEVLLSLPCAGELQSIVVLGLLGPAKDS